MTTAISSLNRAPKAMTYFEPSAVHSVSDPWPDLASEIPGQSASQSGHLSNQARSVRAWLLHACLVLGILLSDTQEEVLAAGTSSCVHSETKHAGQQDSDWRTAESGEALFSQSISNPRLDSQRSSGVDRQGSSKQTIVLERAETNPPGSSEKGADVDGAASISIDRMCQTIEDAARANALPMQFLAHLIWQESRFDPRAVSHAGAQGVAQFMPKTAMWRGLQNPFEPTTAILKSAELLSDLVRQFGKLGLAAAAYNAGPKRVQDWLDRRAGLPKETEAYVRIITGHSADEWRAAKDLLVLNPSTREPVPCPTIAEGSPKANVRMALAPVKQEFAWGVQLVGSGSEAVARAAYQEMQKKYGSLLGAQEPLVLRTSVGRASSWYRVRVGAATRESAEGLCAKLRASGGSCLVQRN